VQGRQGRADEAVGTLLCCSGCAARCSGCVLRLCEAWRRRGGCDVTLGVARVPAVAQFASDMMMAYQCQGDSTCSRHRKKKWWHCTYCFNDQSQVLRCVCSVLTLHVAQVPPLWLRRVPRQQPGIRRWGRHQAPPGCQPRCGRQGSPQPLPLRSSTAL
jgi:hypothetical protein